VRDFGHPDFGVPHGGGGIAVDAAEVALPVDQRVAHGEVLRHADDGVVDRAVAVRVILADAPRRRCGRLACRRCWTAVVFQLVHRVEDAAVHRLEAVAHVGQGAPDDRRSWRSPDRPRASRLIDVDRDEGFSGVFHGGGVLVIPHREVNAGSRGPRRAGARARSRCRGRTPRRPAVELRAATSPDFVDGGLVFQRAAIGPMAGHGVIGVGDGHDARHEGNLVARRPRG
jgi:hypothetical protein